MKKRVKRKVFSRVLEKELKKQDLEAAKEKISFTKEKSLKRDRFQKTSRERFFQSLKTFLKDVQTITIPPYLSIEHHHEAKGLPTTVSLPFWGLVALLCVIIVLLLVSFFIGEHNGFEQGSKVAIPIPVIKEKKVDPSFDACLPYSNATVYKAIVLSLKRCNDFYNNKIPQIPTFNTVYNELIINQVTNATELR